MLEHMMTLRERQREIGRENFRETTNGGPLRKRKLKRATANQLEVQMGLSLGAGFFFWWFDMSLNVLCANLVQLPFRDAGRQPVSCHPLGQHSGVMGTAFGAFCRSCTVQAGRF